MVRDGVPRLVKEYIGATSRTTQVGWGIRRRAIKTTSTAWVSVGHCTNRAGAVVQHARRAHEHRGSAYQGDSSDARRHGDAMSAEHVQLPRYYTRASAEVGRAAVGPMRTVLQCTRSMKLSSELFSTRAQCTVLTEAQMT